MSEELLLDISEAADKPAKKTAAKKAARKVAAKKAAPKKTAARKPAKTGAEETAPSEVEATAATAAQEVSEQPSAPVEAAPAAAVSEPVAAESEAPARKPRAPRKSAVLKKAEEMLAQIQAQEEAARAAMEAAKAARASLEAEVKAAAATETSAPAPGRTHARREDKGKAAPVAETPAAVPAAAPANPTPAAPPAAPASDAPSGEAAATPAPQERRKSKFERWKERRERFRQEKIARQQAAAGGGGGSSGGNQPQAAGGEDEKVRQEVPMGPPEPADGVLELTPKGYGFLRQRERQYVQHPADAFISAEFIRQYGLREGMQVKGVAQKGSRGMQITTVNEVNGRVPESIRDLPLFEELKAINPCKKIQLETVKDRLTTRVIDMFTPVGRGQRGLIVAPPRAGKTTMLQHIAEAVVANHPGIHLMILLVDERPEEVTEFKRILPKAEIYASSNDQDVKSHTRIAAFAVERAKRLVECGEHVFMLMDSITRLARAFNNAKQGGATMSGGMGVGAMEIPRRLFAAARNTRQAGSLTILATALVETGSRMDDLIFQEFKGTGNMELVLDRKIAEQFYYPAVNIFKSGTRREELLLQPFQLDKIHMLRRGLAGHKPIDAIQRVLQLMERYPSNAQMLVDLPSKG